MRTKSSRVINRSQNGAQGDLHRHHTDRYGPYPRRIGYKNPQVEKNCQKHDRKAVPKPPAGEKTRHFPMQGEPFYNMIHPRTVRAYPTAENPAGKERRCQRPYYKKNVKKIDSHAKEQD